MSAPTLCVFSATPGEIKGGFEVFAEMLTERARQRGTDARIVRPSASQFRTATRLLGVGRAFAHLGTDAAAQELEFGKRASHVYVKGEPLDLLWWRAIGNRHAGRVVGMHTPLHYPPAGTFVAFRNFVYASQVFGTMVGRDAKLHLLSEHQIQQLPRSVRNNRRAVIPNGIDCASVVPHRTPDGTLRFLFVGRLTDQKGLDRVTPLLDTGRIAAIDVLGNGPLRASLESRLRPRARFAGHVSRQDVARAMAEHDVLLIPSRWEGHPFTLLEAMALGCVPLVQSLPELEDPLPPSLRWLAVDFDRQETVASALDRMAAAYADAAHWSAIQHELQRRVREQYNAPVQLDRVLDFIFEGTSG